MVKLWIILRVLILLLVVNKLNAQEIYKLNDGFYVSRKAMIYFRENELKLKEIESLNMINDYELRLLNERYIELMFKYDALNNEHKRYIKFQEDLLNKTDTFNNELIKVSKELNIKYQKSKEQNKLLKACIIILLGYGLIKTI